jgi:hypothetical protein
VVGQLDVWLVGRPDEIPDLGRAFRVSLAHSSIPNSWSHAIANGEFNFP